MPLLLSKLVAQFFCTCTLLRQNLKKKCVIIGLSGGDAMIVYVDQIFAVNFAINSLILYITHRTIRSHASRWRIPLVATLGGAYAVVQYIPMAAGLFGPLGRFVFSCILVRIAFSPRGVKAFAVAAAIFYAMTFAFGGAVYAVLGMVDENASHAPIWVLVVSTVAAFIGMTAITSRYKKCAVRERSFVDIDITAAGKTVRVQSLVDTGHSLYEPITGNPVIVVEYGKLKSILPKDLERRMCVIPFRSVGSEGMLTGFRPDSVIIDGEMIKKAVVGIYRGRLSDDGSYVGLVGIIRGECV